MSDRTKTILLAIVVLLMAGIIGSALISGHWPIDGVPIERVTKGPG